MVTEARFTIYGLQLCRPLPGAVTVIIAMPLPDDINLQLCRPLPGAVTPQPRRGCSPDACPSIVPPPSGGGYAIPVSIARSLADTFNCAAPFRGRLRPDPGLQRLQGNRAFNCAAPFRGRLHAQRIRWRNAIRPSIVPPPSGGGYLEEIVVLDARIIPSIVPPPSGGGYSRYHARSLLMAGYLQLCRPLPGAVTQAVFRFDAIETAFNCAAPFRGRLPTPRRPHD